MKRNLRHYGMVLAAGGLMMMGAPAVWAAPAAETPLRVQGFDHTPMYFTQGDNQRQVYTTASFPVGGSFSRIMMHIGLDCPSGGCDPWDRYGTIGVVSQAGAPQAPGSVIELARLMTPYGVGGTWAVDVTEMRPLLRGDATLEASIDTWVGPGSAGGAGWQLSTWFTMKPGRPKREAIAVIPVWSPREVRYGDPLVPTALDAPKVSVSLPPGRQYSLRTFVTGHGQGNQDECAEFCSRLQTIRVNGKRHDLVLWRADCATSGVKGQRGNYWYSRAGWCPGDVVHPWNVEVTSDIGGNTAAIAYAVAAYTNGCRPDAEPKIPTSCTLGTAAEYDGGRHTPPIYHLSTVLIAYR